jgi:hypothetical protein
LQSAGAIAGLAVAGAIAVGGFMYAMYKLVTVTPPGVPQAVRQSGRPPRDFELGDVKREEDKAKRKRKPQMSAANQAVVDRCKYYFTFSTPGKKK